MLRVAAFTSGRDVPSARFRVRQYIQPLARDGITIDEYWPGLGAYPPRQLAWRPPWLLGTLAQRAVQIAAARGADVALIQREMVSSLPTLEALTSRPRVVDVDDSVHLYRGGVAARHLARLADLVIVGNPWLAEIWSAWNRAVEILPTAVDTDRHRPAPMPENPVIGWIGTASNLPYLAAIAPPLARVFARFSAASLALCCDRRPELPGLPVRYVPWSEPAEAAFFASISIGVMPLADGPWERGKCSFKMLQYMAAGRPCVVSPVGMNADLLRQGAIGLPASIDDQWVEALSSLLADRPASEAMGAAGRALVVERYSVTALAPRLAALLRRAL